MPPAGFEPAILGCDRLQIHALDRSATEIGSRKFKVDNYGKLESVSC